MKTSLFLLAIGASAASCMAVAQAAESAPADSLHETIAGLDSAVFDAFNRCANPAQLERHAGFFAEGVEFYHDTGGVTWNRADMLANTKKFVCGNFTRELVPGSLVVHPIKGFGAIALGSHRFCQSGSGTCEGLADFTIIWHQSGSDWKITRVLSYGHRPNVAAP